MGGPTGKGKEKEHKERKKPGRIPTSCAECRRLKLKCDKNIPCSKCLSRGCGSICPEGSLTPGKGNRLILANTEELHDRIDQMASRNRELENALRELQKRVSNDPHPLLRTDLLSVNFLQGSSRESSSSTSARSPTGPVASPSTQPSNPETVYEEDGSARFLGTLYLDRRGEARHFGKTARPEYLIRATPGSASGLKQSPQLSSSILRTAFPEHQPPDSALASDLLSSLPPPDEARRLWSAYLDYGKYLYQPVSEKDLPEYLFTEVNHSRLSIDCLDDLALFFIIFAIGALFDIQLPHYLSVAHGYYALSRAALNLSHSSTNYSLRTIQTMVHTSQYIDMTDTTPSGSDTLWLNLGNAIRLGFNIGLHLDSTSWKLHDDHAQRRHELFWNLFVVDTWASINTGKPPSILKSHVNCPFPRNHSHVSSVEDGPGLDFHSWHTKISVLVHSAAEVAMGPKKPVYSAVLNFDRAIRDFDVPMQWRMPAFDAKATPPTPDVAVYRWLVLSAKEMVILNLHRPYLSVALHEAPADLQRHRFLPSVVASFKAACRIIQGFAATSMANPEFLSRVNMVWSHAMSAAVVISLLVTKAPTSAWACPALDELDTLASLFHSFAAGCPAASNLHPTLEALQLKAHDVIGDPYVRSHYLQDGRTMATAEVERLSGQTQLVSDLSHSSSSLVPSRVPSRATSTTVSDMAEVQQLPTPTDPSFSGIQLEGIHPSLARDIEEYRLRNTIPSAHSSLHDLPTPLQSNDPQRLPHASGSNTPTARVSPYPAVAAVSTRPSVSSVAISPPTHSPQYPMILPRIRAPQHCNQSYTPISSSYSMPSLRETSFNSSSHSSYHAPPHHPSPSQPAFIAPPITLPPGFQPIFQTHSWITPSPIGLDQSWTPFVEQLGFC